MRALPRYKSALLRRWRNLLHAVPVSWNSSLALRLRLQQRSRLCELRIFLAVSVRCDDLRRWAWYASNCVDVNGAMQIGERAARSMRRVRQRGVEGRSYS